MGKINKSISAIGQGLGQLPQVANVSKIAVPHTEIQGRAPIYDLSKIPQAHMGIERVETIELELVPDEIGPDNKQVWKKIIESPVMNEKGNV